MVYRYFIGIEPPQRLLHTIQEVQRTYFDADKLIPPLQPHITVLPPPALQYLPPDEVAPHLATAAAPHFPCPLTLDSTVLFDRRTLAIAVFSPALQHLYQTIARCLPSGSRQQLQSRQFRPHITLCQAKRGTKLTNSFTAQYEQALQPLFPYTFEAIHLTLYRWEAPRTYTTYALSTAL